MSTTKTLIKEKMTFTPPPIEYDLIIGENLLDQVISFAKVYYPHFIMITTDSVLSFLPPLNCEKIVLHHGETIKSRGMKEKIEDALIERGWGRECCLIAIGGGALLDLVGFVAATYCRGVCYISVPTSLIAMTDAAVGGKTGVNVEEAKNWIGAFHHPRKIFIDLNMLNTLPQRDLVFGLAETIKHSLIADGHFFTFLETHLEKILARDTDLLREMIYRSCLLKKGIVEKDPYEREGLRRILNFGHTIGHALETLSNYTRSHGQAVMMGILIEAAVARRLDYLPRHAFERIRSFFDRLPVQLDFPSHLPFEMLKRDKKGAHKFVVLTGIGSVAPFDGEYVTCLTENILRSVWEDVVYANSL